MSKMFVLLDDDSTLTPVEMTPYASEELLQRLLADHPALLPGEMGRGQEDRRWLLVSRELGLPFEGVGGARWSVDPLFLDQDGVPTLVEVKRSSDPRIRREVVGQMLDYASSAPFIEESYLRARFEATCAAIGLDASSQVEALLREQDADVEAYWEQVGVHLRNQRLRLVFLADVIPAELRRVVEFLNGQMATVDVLAVELQQFVGAGVRALVPSVIGATTAAAAVKVTTSRRSRRAAYDREEWLEHLKAAVEPELAVAIETLIGLCTDLGAEEVFGAGSTDAAFWPVWERDDGVRFWPFAIYFKGWFETPFSALSTRPPFDDVTLRQRLLARFNELPGVDLGVEALDRRLNIRADFLLAPGAERAVHDLITSFLTEAGLAVTEA